MILYLECDMKMAYGINDLFQAGIIFSKRQISAFNRYHYEIWKYLHIQIHYKKVKKQIKYNIFQNKQTNKQKQPNPKPDTYTFKNRL